MPDPVYVLERLNWRPAVPRGLWLNLPGADPLRTFHDRSVAEAAARDREWDVRRRVNPFRCGGSSLHYQTTFDAARLHDWFLDLGIDPPAPTTASGTWAAVWERTAPAMTDSQRAGVWDALNRVRFFRVAGRPPGRPMHLVAEPHFEDDPVAGGPFPRESRYVGCTPYMLVRSKETAEDMCRELFVTRLVKEGRYVDHAADLESWARTDPDPLANEQGAAAPDYGFGPGTYAEHRPLDLISEPDPVPGDTVYVVLRRHWRLELAADGSWRWSLTRAKTCGRPVIAFDTLDAANARMAELEAEARRYPAPFRFGPPHEWSPLATTAIYGELSNLAPIDVANLWSDFTAPDHLWVRWWDEAAPTLTPDQVAAAWGLYDWLRFYEVVAVEYRE